MNLKANIPSISLPLAILALCVLPLQAQASADGWARLSGEVTDVTDDSFTLDYVRGSLSIELKNWDWFGKEPAELRGMRVHVAGEIGGSGEEPSMRPSAIYLPELHTCHYSDAKAAAGLTQINDIRKSNEIILVGKLLSIDGREFVLECGGKKTTVDTGSLLYDPTDDSGYQQLKVGDWLTVSAGMDIGFFRNGRLDAKRVISLKPDLAG